MTVTDRMISFPMIFSRNDNHNALAQVSACAGAFCGELKVLREVYVADDFIIVRMICGGGFFTIQTASGHRRRPSAHTKHTACGAEIPAFAQLIGGA